MSERGTRQFLPWMCAGLVLSIELCMKGAFVAFVVGASSLALFVFLLVVLRYLGTMDDSSGDVSAVRNDIATSEIVFETIRIPTEAIPRRFGAPRSM